MEIKGKTFTSKGSEVVMEVVYLLVFQRGSCLTKPLCSYLSISVFSRHQIYTEQGTHTYFCYF